MEKLWATETLSTDRFLNVSSREKRLLLFIEKEISG